MSTDPNEEEVLAWRSFRPIFEEDPLVDQKAPSFDYTFRDGNVVTIFQEPRLAARLDGGNLEADTRTLGSHTEASSATGAVVWDSSVVVGRYLEDASTSDPCALATQAPFDVRGLNVVELGAGCGLLSALVWRLGAAKVVATERLELLPLLARNMAACCSVAMNSEVEKQSPPVVVEYMWGGDVGPWANRCDLILAIDLIYDIEAVEPLISSISLLLAAKYGARASDSHGASCSHSPVALLALDAAFKRPLAREAFFSVIQSKGIESQIISIQHLADDEKRESVSLWALRLKNK